MAYDVFSEKYREVASVTDTGTQRENNEDSLLVLDYLGCYAVSDGMGGGSAGEIASSTIVTYIRNALADAPSDPEQRRERFAEAVYTAHSAIIKYADKHEYEAMGATLVALLLDPWFPARADIYYAGDSRLYRIRGKTLERLSQDHTISTASGIPEKKLPAYMSGLLSNVVGIRSGFFLASATVDIRDHDVFLLCSDGLYRQIPEDKILSSILRGKELETILAQWVRQANAAQGLDNLSVILIRFAELPRNCAPPAAKAGPDSAPEPPPPTQAESTDENLKDTEI